MGAEPTVSVCLPAYNEQATLEDVVREASDLMVSSGIDYEILVCDDGSSDSTPEILEKLAPEIPRLRVLTNRPNRGIHYTFERLYREARMDFVFLNATDGQWPMRCLLDLLPLAERCDIAIASRRDKHYGPLRALVSWSFNRIPRWLFGVETHDAGSVKLVRRELIERIPIVSHSPFSEAERMIRAARAGYAIAAVPVDIQPRQGGEAGGATPRLVWESLLDVARVWWSLRSGTDR